MAKKLQQFNIISTTYERLANNNFNLVLSPMEATRNAELIALADNEVLRAIRKLTHHSFNSKELREMYNERLALMKKSDDVGNRARIKEINAQICNFLFIPEYVSVTTKNKNDYLKLGKNGFVLNGKKYKRLLCGAGHARTNTTFFTTEEIYPLLDKILMAGAKIKEIVPAKFNAYYALASSATHRVPKPRVVVVPDKEIQMVKRVDWVTDNDYQDTIEECEKELTFNLWDGMGLISPRLADIWAKHLGLDYLPSSYCIRAPYVKGMVAVFDFHKFATEIAHKDTIIDLYGKEVNIFDCDIVITQSQFKLWNAYDDWQDYEKCVEESGMRWGVTKFSPKNEVDIIATNYQFLQVLNMNDEDIAELCKPTVDWLKGVSGGDIDDMKLYLMGKCANRTDPNECWDILQDNFLKCLMLDGELLNDSYIHSKIVKSISKKIKESYMGKILIEGNFQTMFADPYGLCEHIFGMEVKGLLNEFEHYSHYWNNKGATELCAMRSPLTWRAEVNLLHLKNTAKMQEWYQYIKSGIIFNVWGLDTAIHSGADFDGDTVCTTNNPVFLRCRYGGLPVLYNVQKAKKENIVD